MEHQSLRQWECQAGRDRVSHGKLMMGAGKGLRGRPAAQNRRRAWCTGRGRGHWAMMRCYPQEVGRLGAGTHGSLG